MDPIEVATRRLALLEQLRSEGEPGLDAEIEHQRAQLRAMVALNTKPVRLRVGRDER